MGNIIHVPDCILDLTSCKCINYLPYNLEGGKVSRTKILQKIAENSGKVSEMKNLQNILQKILQTLPNHHLAIFVSQRIIWQTLSGALYASDRLVIGSDGRLN